LLNFNSSFYKNKKPQVYWGFCCLKLKVFTTSTPEEFVSFVVSVAVLFCS
jgi:hypothetical protein